MGVLDMKRIIIFSIITLFFISISGIAQENVHPDATEEARAKWVTKPDGTITVRGFTFKRFHVVGDGTIIDWKTLLVWQQEPTSEKIKWQEAMDYAKNLRLAGYSNWRLPTKAEIEALLVGHLDADVGNGADKPGAWLARNGFKNIKDSWYWSSSGNDTDTSVVWGVSMFYGDVTGGNKSYGFGVALCVRYIQ
ncbi:MAG TPA: DUF1566 domain-containing protein [Paludibacteraceae bacterium]|nr:DUF1566 domain-containing protein [Paludibacteraceae bacterium]